MKKALSLIAALAIIAVGSISVHAANEESHVTISFEENTGPTKPVNPVDPSLPNPPDGGNNETGSNGPLSLDVVPNFAFGAQKITGNVETYESVNLKPYIQVTDTRGTGAGWKVTASLSSFTEVGNSSEVLLTSATLRLKNAQVKTKNVGNTNPPVATSVVNLTAGGMSEDILIAVIGKGKGTWLNTWLATSQTDLTNANATLQIDTQNVKNIAYEATIDWTLSTTP